MKNSKKSNASRLELCTLSQAAKAQKKRMMQEAKTEAELLYAAEIGINGILIANYAKETGSDIFKKFDDWKKEGFSVVKGSKAFRIWGSPFKAKKEGQTANGEAAEKEFSMFPMCCVFCSTQVEPIDGENNQPEPAAEQPEPEIKEINTYVPGDQKTANKLRKIADNIQKAIDSAFAERLTNTAKRLAQANHARAEGERLKRTQAALYALADLHGSGTIPANLASIKSKKAVYDLMRGKTESVPNGYHSYIVDTGLPASDTPETLALWELLQSKSPEEEKATELQRKVEGLQFSKIPGYFPTPASVIDKMLERAYIQPGDHILEPSAGSGAILDKIPGSLNIIAEAYEVNCTLFEILKGKSYAASHRDFTTVSPEVRADVVLMNPPFENLQDIEHIQHAFKFLKPGGRLVAIMSPSAFSRSDKKSAAFREWFELLNGYEEDLPAGSFKASGTGTNTKLIVIEK